LLSVTDGFLPTVDELAAVGVCWCYNRRGKMLPNKHDYAATVGSGATIGVHRCYDRRAEMLPKKDYH
jgi:hypothetical protein